MELQGLWNQLADRARAANPPKDGDYYEDGTLFCGKCRTPKTCVIELMGCRMQVACLCRCAAEARERAAAELREQERLDRINRLREAAFPDRELSRCVFDRDDGTNPKLTRICRRYAEQFDNLREQGKGLLLYGPVGTGKTFLAACVVNSLVDRGIPCHMTSFARLGNLLSVPGPERQARMDELGRYELLVVDDLAAERDTEFMHELVYSVIDARYRQGLPLIVTTNLTGAELKNPAQIKRRRTYSRLLEMCYPAEVTGQDRRKARLLADYGQFRELLEGKNEPRGPKSAGKEKIQSDEPPSVS